MTSLVLLIVSLVLISLLFTLANAIAWYLFERPRHALVWAVAFGLAALQYGLNLARGAGLVPEIPFWLLANSVSFVLVSCALWGHRLRLQLPTPPRLLLALGAAWCC